MNSKLIKKKKKEKVFIQMYPNEKRKENKKTIKMKN